MELLIPSSEVLLQQKLKQTYDKKILLKIYKYNFKCVKHRAWVTKELSWSTKIMKDVFI